MLVLTRKVGEKILIGDDITITVVDIGKARLKLGIEAPAGHRILRSELIAEDPWSRTGRNIDTDVARDEKAPMRTTRSPWTARPAEAIGA